MSVAGAPHQAMRHGTERVAVPHRPGLRSLDDPRWNQVRRHRLVDVRTGADPRWPGEVQLAWDDLALTVWFTCTADTVRATMTRYKERVWQEDAVEVYLHPPGDPYLYEFQLNPIGTSRDLRVARAGESDQVFDDSWSCLGMETEARIDRGDDRNVCGWRGVFRLPWQSLGTAHPTDDGWRIGLFRIERDPEEYTGLRWCRREVLELHDPRLLADLECSVP